MAVTLRHPPAPPSPKRSLLRRRVPSQSAQRWQPAMPPAARAQASRQLQQARLMAAQLHQAQPPAATSRHPPPAPSPKRSLLRPLSSHQHQAAPLHSAPLLQPAPVAPTRTARRQQARLIAALLRASRLQTAEPRPAPNRAPSKTCRVSRHAALLWWQATTTACMQQ